LSRSVKERLRQLVRQLLPVALRRRLVQSTRWPPVGMVRFGNLRRLQPIDPDWGGARGQPIDRYYIERFLMAHAQDIQGEVLEIGTDAYTRQFGGDRVVRSEVLQVAERATHVTLVADLTDAEQILSSSFDCVILTQTLQFIYDSPAALRTVYRILRPGGVALVTVSGISKISRYDMDRWGHYWSFTTRSMQQLFEASFPAAGVDVEAYGNVLAAIAFLHGLASEELASEELDYIDPDYELLITVRAVKPEGTT
jgi:SAM-dependent methyltransferase